MTTMPKTINNVWGEQWFVCDRCGFDYPRSLMVCQDGLNVCTVHCVFDQGAEYYRSITPIPGEEIPEPPAGDEVTI